ncbi:MAG: carboxypeptidase regulatory-like domain-containing protein [Deltaproteobacteria bacterium]|nr:carboxypeptidase regulatory-like domain-containing protein [Deltaproteobacteria bacterium]
MSAQYVQPSQPEAKQKALELPFLCDGQPDVPLCPTIESIRVTDQMGKPKWNFNPGETVYIGVSTHNPDLNNHNTTLTFAIDDDLVPGGELLSETRSTALISGGSGYYNFQFDVPGVNPADYYHLRASLTGESGCADSQVVEKAVAVNQPFSGQVKDNETGAFLEGATVCAYGIGPNALYVECTQTDAGGNFTLHLPEGQHALFVTKNGYSVDSRVVDTAGTTNPTLGISVHSTDFGKADNSGHAQDPVTTALGNFTLDAEDLFSQRAGHRFFLLPVL